MYLHFERVVAGAAVSDASALSPPPNATHAELQADTADIRYTMDGATNPTQTSGMILLIEHEPKPFVIEDVKRIRFTRGEGSDGGLCIHYFAGRDI